MTELSNHKILINILDKIGFGECESQLSWLSSYMYILYHRCIVIVCIITFGEQSNTLEVFSGVSYLFIYHPLFFIF